MSDRGLGSHSEGAGDAGVEPMPMLSSGGPWARVLVGASAFLLLSMGGAIFAAPLTVPLLFVVARGHRAGAGWRVAATAVAALTMAEVAWAATYLTVAEAGPWIWLMPGAAGAVTAAGFAPTPGRLAAP